MTYIFEQKLFDLLDQGISQEEILDHFVDEEREDARGLLELFYALKMHKVPLPSDVILKRAIDISSTEFVMDKAEARPSVAEVQDAHFFSLRTFIIRLYTQKTVMFATGIGILAILVSFGAVGYFPFSKTEDVRVASMQPYIEESILVAESSFFEDIAELDSLTFEEFDIEGELLALATFDLDIDATEYTEIFLDDIVFELDSAFEAFGADFLEITDFELDTTIDIDNDLRTLS